MLVQKAKRIKKGWVIETATVGTPRKVAEVEKHLTAFSGNTVEVTFEDGTKEVLNENNLVLMHR